LAGQADRQEGRAASPGACTAGGTPTLALNDGGEATYTSGSGSGALNFTYTVGALGTGRSVYFARLADIVSALAKAEREGQLRERIRFLGRTSLLIVDEIGYLPFIPGGGNLFFQLVNARYERGAMILTSNRGFAERLADEIVRNPSLKSDRDRRRCPTALQGKVAGG
jgi:hypothetical protein